VSQKEFQRVKVIENAVAGRLSVSEAAGLLQLSRAADRVSALHVRSVGTLRGVNRIRGWAARLKPCPFKSVESGANRTAPIVSRGRQSWY